MKRFYCYTNSAITSKESKGFLITPVCYKSRLYILNDKKLYYVLNKIDKLQDFLNYTRQNGLKQTRRWLVKNNLMNENFLENVSRYYLNSDVEKAHKYYFFRKDENYKPYISGDMFKNYYQYASYSKFLQENNVAFNIYVEKQLSNIQDELNLIPDFKDFNSRRIFLRNYFFQNIVQNFAQVIDEDLSEISDAVQNLMICYETPLDYSRLKLFHISGIKNYESSQFCHTNIRYKECLPEKTCFDFKIKHKNFDVLEILDEFSEFARNKIDFDRKYINALLNNSSKNKRSLYERSYINKMFCYIGDSNILFDTPENLLRSAISLNLEKANLEHLNKLFYGEQNKIYSLIVQSANDSDSKIYAPYGYARIQC